MMKLHLNATSPYARVARIVALEKGLGERLSLCWSDPWSDEAALLEANPVGRVPVLVTDDGGTIAESLLIAQYLDGLSDASPLLPRAGLARALHLAGLGQGLMDAAFNTVIMRKHHGREADQSVLGQRRLRAIERTLAVLERTYPQKEESAFSLGDIVAGVALDYLAFRMPETGWQDKHPSLRGSYSQLMRRPSFMETAFA